MPQSLGIDFITSDEDVCNKRLVFAVLKSYLSQQHDRPPLHTKNLLVLAHTQFQTSYQHDWPG